MMTVTGVIGERVASRRACNGRHPPRARRSDGAITQRRARAASFGRPAKAATPELAQSRVEPWPRRPPGTAMP